MPSVIRQAEVWGVSPLRSEQELLIRATLRGRDTLGILPTGYGKSLCYQLPAVLLPGLTLVISPLLALMHDQVLQLHTRGVAAASWNSTLGKKEKQALIQLSLRRQLKLLYCAPESLRNSLLQDLLAQTPISSIAVDEAHCISEWGHDFRPEYRQIPLFFERIFRSRARPPLCAVTATATPAVMEDIVSCLKLRAPVRCVRASVRSNLTLRVVSPPHEAAKRRALLHWLASWQRTRSGLALLYVATRDQAEFYARWLTLWGTPAQAFHAGRSALWRQQCLQNARSHPHQCVVATSAFGMGIDLPEIRLVVHLYPPHSLAAYAQEAGRAGRDGEPATAVLFYRVEDWEIVLSLLNKGRIELQKKRNFEQAQLLHSWTKGTLCLRKSLAAHFVGEAHPDAFRACACSHCLPKNTPWE